MTRLGSASNAGCCVIVAAAAKAEKENEHPSIFGLDFDHRHGIGGRDPRDDAYR
jgi:hypothetical protein